jgi:hypothetical protein
VPVTASPQLWKRLAKACCDVIGGSDKTAEDDRVGALGNQRLQDSDERFELWVGHPDKAFSPCHEGCERPLFRETRCWFKIGCIHLVGIVVEDLLFEPLGIGRKAIAERA